MDTHLFSSIIQNLLGTNTIILTDTSIANIEKKFCYNATLQPIYKSENLKKVANDTQPKTIYELSDKLGTYLLVTKLDNIVISIGPFLSKEIDENKLRYTLIDNGIPASVSISIKQYLNAFPIVKLSYAINVVSGCMQSFLNTTNSIDVCQIKEVVHFNNSPKIMYQESLDYSTIYKRYEMENQFLHYIEIGDKTNALNAYEKITTSALNDTRYVNAIYQDVSVGFSMIRALARKAAENGGASPIKIHEITQKAVQNIEASFNPIEMVKCTKIMISSLCDAVKDSKVNNRNYSVPISKTIEYLRLNFSQDITLDFLSKYIGMSNAHLCRTFKNEVGLTINEYISNIRCIEAAKLLKDTDHSITDISAYVGYIDNNYFVKVFKKHFGMTPSVYRNNYKNTGENNE